MNSNRRIRYLVTSKVNRSKNAQRRFEHREVQPIKKTTFKKTWNIIPQGTSFTIHELKTNS